MTVTSTAQLVWKVSVYLVIAVSALTWLLMNLLLDPLVSPSQVTLYFVFALLVFLCCMTGFWAGLGDATWRWIVILPVSPFYAYVMGGNGEFAEFTVFCIGIIGTTMLTTLLLRGLKGRLRSTSNDNFREGLQFGIKDILIWTTATAVLITAGRVISSMGLNVSAGPPNVFLAIFGMAVCIAAVTTVYVWAMFGRRITSLKLVSLVFVLAMQIAAAYLLFGKSPGEMIAVSGGVAQLMTLFVLFGLRNQSIRFVSHS